MSPALPVTTLLEGDSVLLSRGLPNPTGLQGPIPCPCSKTQVVVQILFIHLRSQLEVDSHEGYGIEYGYHLPRETAWS